MDKYLKMYRPYMLKYMRERYSGEETLRRWKNIEALDAKWLREEGDLGGSANPMAMNIMMCYAFFAFYEATDRQMTKEEFDYFAAEALKSVSGLLGRFDMNKIEKNKPLVCFIYSLCNIYKKQVDAKRGKQWGNTWAIRINPEGRTEGVAFTLDTCPLYEFAQKYGYMDFLPNLCGLDQYTARQFHAHLIRHKTLSAGDGACEYWYVGDKSAAALSDTGSK